MCWIRIVDGKRLGYDSFHDCCNNKNSYFVKFNGLIFIPITTSAIL